MPGCRKFVYGPVSNTPYLTQPLQQHGLAAVDRPAMGDSYTHV